MVHVHSPDARARRMQRAIAKGFVVPKTCDNACCRTGIDPFLHGDPWADAQLPTVTCTFENSVDHDAWIDYIPPVQPPMSLLRASAFGFNPHLASGGEQLQNALKLIDAQNCTIALLTSEIEGLQRQLAVPCFDKHMIEREVHTQMMSALSGPISEMFDNNSKVLVTALHKHIAVSLRAYNVFLEEKLKLASSKSGSFYDDVGQPCAAVDVAVPEVSPKCCRVSSCTASDDSLKAIDEPFVDKTPPDLRAVRHSSSYNKEVDAEVILKILLALGFSPATEEGEITYIEQIQWLHDRDLLSEDEYLRRAVEFVEYGMVQSFASANRNLLRQGPMRCPCLP